MEETENRVVRRRKITKDEGEHTAEQKSLKKAARIPRPGAGTAQLFRGKLALLSIRLGVRKSKKRGREWASGPGRRTLRAHLKVSRETLGVHARARPPTPGAATAEQGAENTSRLESALLLRLPHATVTSFALYCYPTWQEERPLAHKTY